jgi:leucyl-tRNA synthetase
MKPEALVRFLGRVVRVAADVAATASAGTVSAGTVSAGTASAGTGPAAGDLELRKATHKTIDEVTRLVESTRLNVAVARLMELVSAARRTIDSGAGAADAAVREAAEALVIMLSLFAPYTAEECWELLGHQPSVARAGWPAADPALLVQDTVTCVVQVDGKLRDRLEVASTIGEDELRGLALAAPGVARALAGRGVRTVIVRAPKLVNIVSG